MTEYERGIEGFNRLIINLGDDFNDIPSLKGLPHFEFTANQKNAGVASIKITLNDLAVLIPRLRGLCDGGDKVACEGVNEKLELQKVFNKLLVEAQERLNRETPPEVLTHANTLVSARITYLTRSGNEKSRAEALIVNTMKKVLEFYFPTVPEVVEVQEQDNVFETVVTDIEKPEPINADIPEIEKIEKTPEVQRLDSKTVEEKEELNKIPVIAFLVIITALSGYGIYRYNKGSKK